MTKGVMIKEEVKKGFSGIHQLHIIRQAVEVYRDRKQHKESRSI